MKQDICSNLSNTDKPCIIITSCDKYEFVWQGLEYYFNKFWDIEFGADVFLITENKTTKLKNICTWDTHIDNWGERIIYVLKEIPHTHILFLNEDSFPLQKINLQQYYTDFITHECDALRLTVPSQAMTFQAYDNKYLSVTNTSEYLISHQPAIWKKTVFSSVLEPHMSPWNHEIEGTRKLRKHQPFILTTNTDIWWYERNCVNKGTLTQHGLKLLQQIQ